MRLMPADFFDLSSPETNKVFQGLQYPWSPLTRIKNLLEEMGGHAQQIKGQVHPGAYLGNAPIYVAEGATVEPGAYIIGPAYILV